MHCRSSCLGSVFAPPGPCLDSTLLALLWGKIKKTYNPNPALISESARPRISVGSIIRESEVPVPLAMAFLKDLGADLDVALMHLASVPDITVSHVIRCVRLDGVHISPLQQGQLEFLRGKIKKIYHS